MVASYDCVGNAGLRAFENSIVWIIFENIDSPTRFDGFAKLRQ